MDIPPLSQNSTTFALVGIGLIGLVALRRREE
ncbi:MAG: PEP-CTERM sorting domain-containing protein [Methanosarcinales archaeon]|nr:PEP-CTERM sorting domain-containing protein [Methanosarcinales archaeon]